MFLGFNLIQLKIAEIGNLLSKLAHFLNCDVFSHQKAFISINCYHISLKNRLTEISWNARKDIKIIRWRILANAFLTYLCSPSSQPLWHTYLVFWRWFEKSLFKIALIDVVRTFAIKGSRIVRSFGTGVRLELSTNLKSDDEILWKAEWYKRWDSMRIPITCRQQMFLKFMCKIKFRCYKQTHSRKKKIKWT